MGVGVATSMSLAGAVEADDTNPTTRKTDLPHGNPLRVPCEFTLDSVASPYREWTQGM